MKKLLVLFLFFSANLGFAQTPDMDELFQWTVNGPQDAVQQGESATIEAVLHVKEDHIVYQHMTSFSFDGPEGISMGEMDLPEAKEKEDPTDGKIKKVYVGETVFAIPAQVGQSASVGVNQVTLTVKYQGCSQTLCFFPQTRQYPVALTVAEGQAGDGMQPAEQPADATAAIEGAPATTGGADSNLKSWIVQGGIWTFLVVFVLGFLTSLTPCVYPLIPITISIFGAKETQSRFHAFTLALTYVLGIAIMYSTLGFFAAKTGAVFGAFITNPWVVGAIAVFFIALGLSMMGVYEFQLPMGLQNKMSAIGGKGYSSAFVMGLVAGVVAAPCTGPVLAAILAYVAASQNTVYGVSLLFVYSLGLGIIFLVIGTYSNLISRLPKSGGWMEGVKSFFAIIMFAAALYFLKEAFPLLKAPLSQSLGFYALSAVLLVAGLALGGLHLSLHGPTSAKIRKTVGVLLSTIAIYFIAGGLALAPESDLDWVHNDIDKGLAMAKEEKKPVMIDFYADWCAACKELDAFTYSDDRVEEELKDYVNIKVDYESPEVNKDELKEEYNIPGLPLVVFYDSKGNRLPDKRITGYMGPDKFLEHIKDIE
ncbi:protein-disulfide reductase DsbD [bacterium]|nr:protein-disulfide reductase DsbD [bacterium]